MKTPFREDKLRETLQDMVTSLLTSKPSDPLPLMLQHLEEAKGAGEDQITNEEREELLQMRAAYQELREKVMNKASDVDSRSVDSASSCSEEEDEILPLETPKTKP